MQEINPNYPLDNAHSAFIVEAIAASKKIQKVRKNMECRRELERRMEERQLRHLTCEFEFELSRG